MMDIFDILMWENKPLTGAALGGANALFLAVVFLDLSLTPFLCKVGVLAIFLGLVGKFAHLTESVEAPTEIVPKESMEKLADHLALAVNTAAEKMASTVMWKSNGRTLKALVALEVLRRVSAFVSLTFMAWLVVNSIFVVPFIMEKKWDLIAEKIQPLQTKAQAMFDKIPKYTDIKDLKAE
eukprot:CAMPEP_0206467238 /NCGR_PEP_ID=MMETSP0324_2-20121206/28922_1 /ASSEMBLY_ACC=CAM_ASM_000836 /TAXON_ID=2866 /ORGANISM="Crypthecodinium cohnii, Strain Seligo" /LENGTH=180 /DNA_ID=CAMNT_0053940481 /DNA_START=64 /DNA_END=606 /DNA_ORIENTATION=+